MVDVGTIKQIRSMIKHEAIEHARIMPDCHKGVGCCIGFTSKLTDKIVPNFVGGDIGCGIISYPLDLKRGIKPKQLCPKKQYEKITGLIKMLHVE